MRIVALLLGSMFFWSTVVVLSGLFLEWLRRNRAAPPKQDPETKLKFACVICAHNEEKVIDRPIRSLLASDYPRDRFQIVVFADNCADRTAEIARSFPGVDVREKRIPSSGKGDVLAWGLDQIRHEGYDAIAIFDADNEASPGWLSEMNRAFAGGSMVVTGHRMVSNPFANLITGWYTLYWNLMNELSNRVRSTLNMSAMLTGTGFAFRVSVLPEQGWRTVTFVEDLEFAISVNFAGNHVDYIPDAIFYDEQPVSVRPMFRQLNRWATGGLQIIWRYFGSWIRALRSAPSFRVFDCFAVVTLGLSGTALLIVNGFLLNWVFGIAFLFTSWASVIIATSLSRYSLRSLFLPILMFPVFTLILSYTVLYSLFFPQRSWKPIAHGN